MKIYKLRRFTGNLSALFLVLSPGVLIPDAEAQFRNFLVIVGMVIAGYSTVTDYEGGLTSVISLWVHRFLDTVAA